MKQLQSRMDYAAKRFRQAEYEEARIVFTSLLKTYKKQQATKEVCLCLYRLACIAYVRGEVQNFQQLFHEYQALAKPLNDLQLRIEYYVLCGLAELGVQRYEHAIKAFTQVLALTNDEQFIKQKVSASLYIQRCHILLEDYEKSLEMSDFIWQEHADVIHPDTGQLFHYLLNRADTMLALGRLQEADGLITQCERHADYAISPIEHIKTMLTRAKYQLADDEPQLALTMLEQAEVLALEQENANALSEIYETYVKNHEQLNNPQQALVYAKKRLKLQKNLLPQQ